MTIAEKYKENHVQEYLGFGIHENIVIREVSTERRKKSDGSGSYLPSHIYITFTKVSPEGKPLEEKLVGIMPTKFGEKWFQSALFRELFRLQEILGTYYPPEEVNKALDPFPVLGISSEDQIDKVLGQKAKLDEYHETLRNQFVAAVTPLIGLKSQYKMRLKLTYSKDGKYVELPSINFLEAASVAKEQSKLKLDDMDLKRKAEAVKAVSADKPAGAPITAPHAPVTAAAAIPGGPSASPAMAPAATAAPAPAATAGLPTVSAPAPAATPVAAESAPIVVPPAEAIAASPAAPANEAAAPFSPPAVAPTVAAPATTTPPAVDNPLGPPPGV